MNKRKRGRPRVHEKGTETITVRVPVGLGAAIRSAVAAVKLYNQEVRTPDGVILAEALKTRLRLLENRNPEGIRRQIAHLDKALETHYPLLRGASSKPST